jgi:chemotaxis protein MotA
VAGGLPAFGIVAAVLGVVNTMGSVGQPPAVLGGMIGSALVGTFLGILLAYAFAEPLAGLLEQKVEEAGKELQCIKTTLLASMQGYARRWPSSSAARCCTRQTGRASPSSKPL